MQRDLGTGFSLELSYLFTRGLHITRNRDINQFKRTGFNPFFGLPCFVRFPTAVATSATSCLGASSDFRNPLRFQDNIYESTANSFYNAGTISLQRRFANNFSINMHYTYAKSIDEVTDFNSDWSAQNPLNLRVDRALSAFDQRHRAVFSGVFGSPWDNKFLKDWIFAPIVTAQSGRPFNLLLGIDANNDGRSQSDRPFDAATQHGHGRSLLQLRRAARAPLPVQRNHVP